MSTSSCIFFRWSHNFSSSEESWNKECRECGLIIRKPRAFLSKSKWKKKMKWKCTVLCACTRVRAGHFREFMWIMTLSQEYARKGSALKGLIMFFALQRKTYFTWNVLGFHIISIFKLCLVANKVVQFGQKIIIMPILCAVASHLAFHNFQVFSY